jgi:6-methylsalicylate decarboxylase
VTLERLTARRVAANLVLQAGGKTAGQKINGRTAMIHAPGRRAFFRDCTCCVTPGGLSATAVDRRSFLAGGAAVLGAVAAPPLLGSSRALAQAKGNRIDVHHHIVPPTWFAAMEVIGRSDFPLKSWSIQKTLEDMDKGGVATSITSPTTPQVTPLGKEVAVRIARESNEYAKKLETDHPGRFGTWAMLPLPHIDESLKEIAYVFDTLKVDGIGCMTSYTDKWLGDPHFAPVWEELNRRKATVYTHPTAANCCANLMQEVPAFVVEYGADTTRTIASLILSGTSQKYKDINWIWSHGGGVLTGVAYRFQQQIVNAPPYRGKITLDQMNAELRRFYYDTAAIPGAVTLRALAELVTTSQILYGTDFPYGSSPYTTEGVNAFFKGDDLAKIDRENALRLIPRLKSA